MRDALRAGAPGARTLLPSAVLLVLLAAAAAAPLVAPYLPESLDLVGRRAAPSPAHWFGTDELGRDVLSRVIWGARVSLAVGLLSAAVSAALGVAVGAASGYAGGWVDDALMRATDAMLSVPRLPLLMIAGAVLEPSVPTLILLIGAAGWMETARIVRAEFLSLKRRDFVEAAHAVGAGHGRIVVRHILPNAAPPALVATTLAVGQAILLESALSFFGVGVQPPTPTWGNMLYQAQTAMSTEPWLAFFPGFFIVVTVLSINVLGDEIGHHS